MGGKKMSKSHSYFLSSFNEEDRGKIWNSFTKKSINYGEAEKEFIDLCLSQQLLCVEESFIGKILQLALAEFVYRGIIIPIEHKDKEEDYLQSIALFMPQSNSFFNAASVTEDIMFNLDTKAVVFCDVACDIGAARPGSRFGAEILRNRSRGMLHRAKNFTVLDLMHSKVVTDKIYDIGSLNIPQDSVDNTLKRIKNTTEKIPGNCFPIFVGGDHLMSLPLIEGRLKHHPDLTVVQLDHHLDIQLWDSFETSLDIELSKNWRFKLLEHTCS